SAFGQVSAGGRGWHENARKTLKTTNRTSDGDCAIRVNFCRRGSSIPAVLEGALHPVHPAGAPGPRPSPFTKGRRFMPHLRPCRSPAALALASLLVGLAQGPASPGARVAAAGRADVPAAVSPAPARAGAPGDVPAAV